MDLAPIRMCLHFALMVNIAMVSGKELLKTTEATLTETTVPIQVSLLSASTFSPSDYDDSTPDPFGMESVVAPPLRVWHLAAIVGTAISIIIVILCCIFDCRIPRSKEEIEKNNEKRRIAFKYADEMTKIHVNDMQIVTKEQEEIDATQKKQANDKESADKKLTKNKHGAASNGTTAVQVEEDTKPKRHKKKRKKASIGDVTTPLANHPSDMNKPSKKASLALGVPNEKATARTLAELPAEQKKRSKVKNPKV